MQFAIYTSAFGDIEKHAGWIRLLIKEARKILEVIKNEVV